PRPSRPRRFRVRARGRIGWDRYHAVAAAGARRRAHGAADRTAGKPRGGKSPRGPAHPAPPPLCEARPIPGPPARRGRGGGWARDLETLQDKMAPFAQVEAERAVEVALGKPVGELFASFGAPVAAASIAQVHRAAVATGRDRRAVAVKVLRPGVERRFKVDLDAFVFAARNAEKMSAEARRLRLVEVVETLRRTVAIEMDLRLEAAALSEMAENTKNDPDFRVPTVDWDRTARDVLTLEWIEATPLSDRARLEAKGFDLKRLARAVIQTFL